MNKYCLFLDDERNPSDVSWMDLPRPAGGWSIVRSFEAFQATILARGMPAFISFDHDLGQHESGSLLPSGMDCAKWLVEFCMDTNARLPGYCVHSKNPSGKANIEGLFASFERQWSPRRVSP